MPIPGDASMGTFSRYQQFSLDVDRTSGSYGVSSTESVPSIEKAVFSSADLVSNPPSVYVQPPINLVFQKTANGANYTLSTGSIITAGEALNFTKNIIYAYNGRLFGEVALYCTTGIATTVSDIPVSGTFNTDKSQIVSGRIVDRARFNPDLRIAGGEFQLTFDRSANSVALDFALRGTQPGGTAILLGNVHGNGVIDPATGRFSGQLIGADQDADSNFTGSFYGPTASEVGLVIKGRGRSANGDPREFLFSAAGRR